MIKGSERKNWVLRAFIVISQVGYIWKFIEDIKFIARNEADCNFFSLNNANICLTWHVFVIYKFIYIFVSYTRVAH